MDTPLVQKRKRDGVARIVLRRVPEMNLLIRAETIRSTLSEDATAHPDEHRQSRGGTW